MPDVASSDSPSPVAPRSFLSGFSGGAVVGVLGGLIGLGGAEFRLPLLIGVFRFQALDAVILNKAMSLVVVTAALLFRAPAVPFDSVAAQWAEIVNLLAGSLLGAWVGAGWAMRLRSRSLLRVIAVLLAFIAVVLMVGHDATGRESPFLSGPLLAFAGAVAGFGIGVVASLLGVAGGELLIPTLILLFGLDVKLAGSVSLVVSLPTMLVGFARYGAGGGIAVLAQNRVFATVMAIGSIAGALVGGLLLGIVSNAILLPLLAVVLAISAIKVWRHG